jgi:hypothetical protein
MSNRIGEVYIRNKDHKGLLFIYQLDYLVAYISKPNSHHIIPGTLKVYGISDIYDKVTFMPTITEAFKDCRALKDDWTYTFTEFLLTQEGSKFGPQVMEMYNKSITV